MSDVPNQQQQQQQLQQPNFQQQPFYPPPPSYQYQSWPQGWGYVQTQPQGPQATPLPPPRAVVAEPPGKRGCWRYQTRRTRHPRYPARPGGGPGAGWHVAGICGGGSGWGFIRPNHPYPPAMPTKRLNAHIATRGKN